MCSVPTTEAHSSTVQGVSYGWLRTFHHPNVERCASFLSIIETEVHHFEMTHFWEASKKSCDASQSRLILVRRSRRLLPESASITNPSPSIPLPVPFFVVQKHPDIEHFYSSKHILLLAILRVVDCHHAKSLTSLDVFVSFWSNFIFGLHSFNWTDISVAWLD